MSIITTSSSNTSHKAACVVATSSLQVVNQTATKDAAGQAAMNAAAITWARAVIASAVANNGGFGVGPAVTLLKSLGG